MYINLKIYYVRKLNFTYFKLYTVSVRSHLLHHFRGKLHFPLLKLPGRKGMQGVGNGAIFDPQGQVGAVDLQGSFEAVQDRGGVLPDGAITLQLIGVQLVLNAARSSQSHASPGVKPAQARTQAMSKLPPEHCTESKNKICLLLSTTFSSFHHIKQISALLPLLRVEHKLSSLNHTDFLKVVS